jgi:hypothetical protein
VTPLRFANFRPAKIAKHVMAQNQNIKSSESEVKS